MPNIPDTQLDALRWHAWRVHEANRSINLTRIVDPQEMAQKHVCDSLIASSRIPARFAPGLHILDVGTGAGWPGLALAIMCPETTVTLMDATRKKVDFIQSVVEELELESRVTTRWARLEAPDTHSLLQEVDTVVARAVGPVRRILGWLPKSCPPEVVLWKGPAAPEELHEARGQLARLGLRKVDTVRYSLESDPVERVLLHLARS